MILHPVRCLAPDAPALRDSSSNLIWMYKNTRFTNPVSWLSSLYNATTNTFIGTLHMSDTLLNNFLISSYFGINNIVTNENSDFPIAAQDTTISDLGSGNRMPSILIKAGRQEWQLKYLLKIKKIKNHADGGQQLPVHA